MGSEVIVDSPKEKVLFSVRFERSLDEASFVAKTVRLVD